MSSRSASLPLFIVLTFITSLFLSALPIPHWAAWFKPEWSLLFLIYWHTREPELVGLTAAFAIGLALDCLYGSVLGVHALALVITLIGANLSERIFRVNGLLVQTTVIFALVITYLCVLLATNALLKQQMPTFWAYWAPAAVASLLWPWLSLLLDVRLRLRWV